MLTKTAKPIVIDDKVSASELCRQWINGNHKDVLNALENDHAGLTALVLTCGILDDSECNSITNCLIDRRRELLLSSE